MPSQSDAALWPASVRDTIDFRRFPWIRPLVPAVFDGFAAVEPLFAGNPGEPSAWRETISRVQRAPRARDVVSRTVAAQLHRRGAPQPAKDAAALLAAPDTVAVVTGQQAGAFGGPIYTLLKAVTSLQLARKIEQEHGVPAVALFWVDAEDHDWDEIGTLTILDRDFAPSSLSLARLPGAGTQPAGRLVVDETAGQTIEALAHLLAPTEFTADIVACLRRHYRPGATMSVAFASLMDELLGSRGLVVFEADDPAAKAGIGDLFARELTSPLVAGRAREAAALMTTLGHSPQVDAAEDAVCLFCLDASGRRPIRCEGDTCVVGDATRTMAELAAEATAHPERFSPNVLLRPVVQDRLFPTVCYVAGPSELAYHAQLGGAYRALGVERPLLYPRVSATILDSAAVKFLERHALPLEALQAQDESALNRLLEGQLPPEIDRILEETTRHFEGQSARLKDVVTAVDPTLAGVVDSTVTRVQSTLESLQTKIIQASKKKDETLRRQFARTRALAFPGGQPQERALNVAFFLNRYGLTVGERLMDVLPTFTGKHYVITL